LRAYAAVFDKRVVGMIVWFVGPEVAYYHLAAYSEEGYEQKASFALFWHCLQEFASENISWAALGAGAGTFASSEGLSRFKAGWSTETRPAYFCGKIINRAYYDELVVRRAQPPTKYFPAYRAPAA
jgi:hypothetical protein